MPAESALLALLVTAVAAALARLLRAVDGGGAAAGMGIGALVSVALGLPGLAVLGTFFVVGSLATRVGWRRKIKDGTAERGGGARGAKRVLGKGLVAALAALLPAPFAPLALSGAMAAALGDTLGTEIGTLSRGATFSLPACRRVPAGTPGGVSGLGTLATLAGAVIVALVTLWVFGLGALATGCVVFGGFVASGIESIARRGSMPGWTWNLVTTAVGATLATLPYWHWNP